MMGDSETKGDATDITKPKDTSDEGENQIQSTTNQPTSGKDIFAQFYSSNKTTQVLLEYISLWLESSDIRNLNKQIWRRNYQEQKWVQKFDWTIII